MKTWTYLNNVFLNVSKYSYVTAFTISNYHDAQLDAHQTDPFFSDLYTAYHPLHVALSDAYTIWKAQGNKRSGSTLTLDQLLTLLSPAKSNDWEYKIRGVYSTTAPEYKALLPQHLKPFYRGTIESRINVVKTLAKSLEDFPSLATLHTEVNDFYLNLDKARSIQLGNKGTTGDKSIVLENAITAAMIEMYANLGLCMNHYKTEPKQAEPFFDLETIRNHNQLVFKRTVKAGMEKNVLEHTFVATDTINVINDGNADLTFYLAPQNNSPKDNLMTVVVAKSTTAVITMGNLDIANTHLNVVNLTADDGHCIVELI